MKKQIKEMTVTEMEEEVGTISITSIRKKVIEERLYEQYKEIGKR